MTNQTCYCHLDVNSFYAAVEEARLYPALVGKPVAVRQRKLLVTSNYVARAAGLPKMCGVDEGLRLVPELVVIESDMSRYRAAHRQLFDLLREFGLSPERASIDEAYLDLTPLLGTVTDPALWQSTNEVVVYGNATLRVAEDADDAFLARGVCVANRLRQLIRERLRFETSAGVSVAKAFSKFGSGLHKPSRTTVIPVSSHAALLDTLAPNEINGIGPVVWERLKELCAERPLDPFVPTTLASLRALEAHELDVLGSTGPWVYDLCRGRDQREVRDKGPPGSFGFQAAHRVRLSSMAELYDVILDKSEQMAARLEEDQALYQRVCRTLSVSFQFEGKSVTRAVPMPASGETRAAEIAAAAMAVLSKHQKKDPSVVQSQRFGLTAGGFSAEGSGVVERAITGFLVEKPVEWPVAAAAVAAAVDAGSDGPLTRFLVTRKPSDDVPRAVATAAAPAKKRAVIKDMLLAVQTEACPVCAKSVVVGQLNAHVNGHFADDPVEEEETRARKGARPIEAFLKRK